MSDFLDLLCIAAIVGGIWIVAAILIAPIVGKILGWSREGKPSIIEPSASERGRGARVRVA